VVHNMIICDGCQMSPLTGIRFKCFECVDFDLCNDCHESKIHNHIMVKLPHNNYSNFMLRKMQSKVLKFVKKD